MRRRPAFPCCKLIRAEAVMAAIDDAPDLSGQCADRRHLTQELATVLKLLRAPRLQPREPCVLSVLVRQFCFLAS